jgi:hypothetical protein
MSWTLSEPDIASARERFDRPLEALAQGEVPAIVLRGAFPLAECRGLVERLITDGYLYDSREPVPENFLSAAVPEGFFSRAIAEESRGVEYYRRRTGQEHVRIDIGTSLGCRGEDREAFFEHSRESREIFSRLFSADCDPVSLIYDSLQELSVDKKVETARESDGSLYGPAILRAHYGGYAYAPHFDSVRLREKRAGYAVHSFEHQFAGVLVLQNTSVGDRTAQSIIHRCPWEPAMDPCLEAGTFHDYTAEKGIDQVEVVLEPGDLYFFNTRMIHEVPGLAGADPRIVLATFIGYSADRDEIFVWS